MRFSKYVARAQNRKSWGQNACPCGSADKSFRVLADDELARVSGGFVNFAIGGTVGLGIYAGTHWWRGQPMTWQGAAFAAGTGALTGGIGGALIGAAGGGLAGNLAWRPGMIAVNNSFSRYSNYRGW